MSNRKEQEKLLQKVNENQGIIFKICNSYCHNKNEREDLAQEIIYQLLKSAHSFNEQYKFSTWLYRVALNVAISFYRKNKINKLISFVENPSDTQDYNGHSVELEDNISILKGFIDQLKELDKALMILYLETKSYKEISEILGITETNVATKISRIKNSLKQKFSEINQ
ncbi:MAG TPA: sigma-70 family RNA polymerase sigma factor [Hanamia sp.]|jgi:RNA polymerase sigma factor (sigma-70 family)|nr:sigma-70 family RNA polymerase sigma factor [Hanamia sp.]